MLLGNSYLLPSLPPFRLLIIPRHPPSIFVPRETARHHQAILRPHRYTPQTSFDLTNPPSRTVFFRLLNSPQYPSRVSCLTTISQSLCSLMATQQVGLLLPGASQPGPFLSSLSYFLFTFCDCSPPNCSRSSSLFFVLDSTLPFL